MQVRFLTSILWLTSIILTPPLANAKDNREAPLKTSDKQAETTALEIFKDDNLYAVIEKLPKLGEELQWLKLAIESRILMSQGNYDRSETLLRDAERQSPGRSLDYVDKILGIIDINLARRTRSQKVFEHLLIAYDKRHNGTTPDVKKYQQFFDERQFNQDYPLEISNLSPDSPITLTIEDTERVPRISVPIQIGSRTFNFLLDTGAETTFFDDKSDNINLIKSDINVTMYTLYTSGITNQLSKLPHIKIKQLEIDNLRTLLVKHDHFNHLLEKDISGYLGSDIIDKIGGVRFWADDYIISNAQLLRPEYKKLNPLKGNLLTYYRQPHVKVSIGDEVYSCVFDTGATKSYITKPIYKKHKKELDLKLISGKKLDKKSYNRDYLSRPFEDRNYLIKLPVKTGGVNIILQRVVVSDSNKFPGDCLIGLDAVLEAGGAKLDFVNYEFELGPQGQPIQ